MVSYVQSLLANFFSAYYRITTWPPQKKKSASSCFQHLSAKFALFWFSNFFSAYYRITTWPPQKKKSASSCFQHLSAKFALFWFSNFFSAYYRITTWPPQKKNQLLLVSSTSRPNLLCFGFDLTQSQSSKPISRNGYGPN